MADDGGGVEEHGDRAEDVDGGFEGHQPADEGTGVVGVEGDGGWHCEGFEVGV